MPAQPLAMLRGRAIPLDSVMLHDALVSPVKMCPDRLNAGRKGRQKE